MIDWKSKGFLGGSSDEIDQLTQAINESSIELRNALDTFAKAMNKFATERSLESCLDTLNSSIQIANIRGKLVESYEYYSRLLEGEVRRLTRVSAEDRER